MRAASDDAPALGVGIKHSQSGLAWCTSDANGYGTNITDLNGTLNSGFVDGSTGLEKLKAACSDAKTSLDKYPAWQFCAEYGATNKLEGDLATGWYLPTMAELYRIYQNKETVEASLTKAGGDTFGSNYYWSSCQYSSSNDSARRLRIGSGDANNFFKDYNHSVCSVRAFN